MSEFESLLQLRDPDKLSMNQALHKHQQQQEIWPPNQNLG